MRGLRPAPSFALVRGLTFSAFLARISVSCPEKMKKILGLLTGVILVLVAVGVVFAARTPPFPQPAEKDLQKVIFIRYAPGFQKDKPCDYDGVCDPDEKGWCSDCKGEPTPTPAPTACYDFLSGSQPKWNWAENYYYSANNLGNSSAWATATWDEVTSATIFGSGLSGTYSWGVYDLKNAISYGNYPEVGVIAVTAIWFRAKTIYEYDIMFDTDYFPGTSVDLETVVLHEFGHGAGLDDLYDVVCSDEVMYWLYTGVKKTLGSGDIIGIQTLYGK